MVVFKVCYNDAKNVSIYCNKRFSYKQHFYKQRQTESGKKSSNT